MKKTITAKLVAAILLSTGALTAGAQNVIEEGVAFQPESKTVYEFTPSMDGVLTIKVDAPANFMYMRNWSYMLYSSSEISDENAIPNSGYKELSSNESEYTYPNLEEGSTYYFYTDIYGGVDCTLTMSEYTGEGISKVTPSTENLFNYVVMQDIQVYGSSSIESIGEITLSYGTTSVTLDPEVYIAGLNGREGNLFIQITGVELQKLVSTVANSGAKSFTITINDVKTNYGEVVANESGDKNVTVDNGTVKITYDVTPAAQYLDKDSTWPAPFYSSWEERDPLGMATLSFDQDIASVGEVSLIMGYFEEGMISEMDSYDLTGKTTVKGNNVIIDFTGVTRSSSTKQVTVIVQNVRGVNGLTANMGESSTVLAAKLLKYLDFSNEAASENPNIPDEPETPDTPGEVKYMDKQAAQINETINAFDSAVELEWPETVTVLDAENIEIPVYKGTDLVGNLTSVYINLVGGGTGEPSAPLTRVETGESGTVMFLLLGASGLIEEPGLYTLRLPEGMVENEDGAINKEQLLAVVYENAAEGVASPESGTVFGYGEDVVITITFEGTVEENYSTEAPVVVTDYSEYDEQFNWADGVVYIEGNAIVINLGSELEEGTYYLSLREGVVLVDGVSNSPLTDYMFIVGDDDNAVESIYVENGKKDIYNLNGVKVNDKNLVKGIYIISGKKVIVK